MAIGIVKWFNNAKGYGFILPEDGGEDLFAHYSSIEMEGYRTLKAGQPVQFEVQQGPKGLHAVHICAVESDEEPAFGEDSPDDTDADTRALSAANAAAEGSSRT